MNGIEAEPQPAGALEQETEQNTREMGVIYDASGTPLTPTPDRDIDEQIIILGEN